MRSMSPPKDPSLSAKRHASSALKNSCSAASKISRLMDEVFLPMLEADSIKPLTLFNQVSVYDCSIIDRIAVENAALVESKLAFLDFLSRKYDEWKAEHEIMKRAKIETNKI